jgi:hypothetical protein
MADQHSMPGLPDSDQDREEEAVSLKDAPEILDNQAAREIDALHGSASHVLKQIAELADESKISIGAILDALEERAFGMLLLLFAIPALIPFLVGVSSAFALPIALLACQLIAGHRRPWLPKRIRTQTISITSYRKMTKVLLPWLRRVEALTKPRLKFFAGRFAEPVLAIFILVFAAIIAIPGPGTNGVPGIAVGLIALAMIERDGVLAIIGALLGAVYSALFFTIGYKAINFAIDQAMRVFHGG